MRAFITASAAVAALALAGCSPVDHGIGTSLATVSALQVIDPDPHYTGSQIPGGDGNVAARAAENYRKGTVNQPVSMKTSSIGTQAGASSDASSPMPQ